MKEVSGKTSAGGPMLFVSFLTLILGVIIFVYATSFGQGILSIFGVVLFIVFLTINSIAKFFVKQSTKKWKK